MGEEVCGTVIEGGDDDHDEYVARLKQCLVDADDGRFSSPRTQCDDDEGHCGKSHVDPSRLWSCTRLELEVITNCGLEVGGHWSGWLQQWVPVLQWCAWSCVVFIPFPIRIARDTFLLIFYAKTTVLSTVHKRDAAVRSLLVMCSNFLSN